MKVLSILFYAYLTLYWGYELVQLIRGIMPETFTIGVALFITAMTFLEAMVKRIGDNL